ncbi:MAG TPA: hypothetical protein VHM70_29190 [Polyangiaceae bacterium]|nr:hypothetical protein [Polyangiaceae bacterium]
MPRLILPSTLKDFFFDELWDTPCIWALPTAVTSSSLDGLWWHAALPIWSTVRHEARFDLRPLDVVAHPERYPRHWDRILAADRSYPLELFQKSGRWVIVDGYHRLIRHRLAGAVEVRVRLHSASDWPRVRI